jgi:hypothetical protein
MKNYEFPLLVTAPNPGAGLPDHLAGRWQEMEAQLAEHGAVLYRGFAPMSGDQLGALRFSDDLQRVTEIKQVWAKAKGRDGY